MSDREKISVLRAALGHSTCTYHLLYLVPKVNLGLLETPEMHRIWCLRCRTLEATK